MKEETLIMTIDLGNKHFNAIYLNNQLKLIASDGGMITIDDRMNVRVREESSAVSKNSFDFLSIDDSILPPEQMSIPRIL